jgi:dihydrofolate synthase/folylpolyglutamate synthase
VVILEVGLGGRLDATNIVDADVAVVTSIALDHTDWLGPDRESIGREKAGIFRAGKPAVVGEPEMPHTIAEVAAGKGAMLLRRDVDWRYGADAQTWSFSDGEDAGGFTVASDPAAECGNGAGGAAGQPTSGERAGDSRRY